jgi:hypothetical protein
MITDKMELKLSELKDIAKRNNIKKVSAMSKRALYDFLKSKDLLTVKKSSTKNNVTSTPLKHKDNENSRIKKKEFDVNKYCNEVISEKTILKLSDDTTSHFAVISEEFVKNRELIYGDYDEGNDFEDLELEEQWEIVEKLSGIKKHKIFFGDTIQFSTYRACSKYFVTIDKTFTSNPDLYESGSDTIPYEITRHLRDAMQVYNKNNDTILDCVDCIYLHCQDAFIKKHIIGNIPESWDWSLTYEFISGNLIYVETKTCKKVLPVPFGTTVEAILHFFDTRDKERDSFEFSFKLQNYLFKFENKFLQTLPEKHRTILIDKLNTQKLEDIRLPLTWAYNSNKNIFYGPSDEFESICSFLKSSIIQEQSVCLLPDNSYFTSDPLFQNGRIYKNDNGVKKELLGIICDGTPILIDLFEFKH